MGCLVPSSQTEMLNSPLSWETITGVLKIKRGMSTAFHPQTDGQNERVNQSIEPYLHTFCNYEHNNCSEMLRMGEYTYNNS